MTDIVERLRRRAQGKLKRSEHSLQIAVNHMLQLVLDPQRTWYSSIDHGVGKLSPAEAGIRRRRGVKPGIPDVIVMWIPAGDVNNGMIGIELKAGKGRLSEAQEEVSAAWDRMGHSVYVAHSLECVQEILEACGVPLRRRMNFMGGDHAGKPVVRPKALRHKRPSCGRKPKVSVPTM